MTIVNFTPWAGLIGGLLIGASASLLLWLNGRIAGTSQNARAAPPSRPA